MMKWLNIFLSVVAGTLLCGCGERLTTARDVYFLGDSDGNDEIEISTTGIQGVGFKFKRHSFSEWANCSYLQLLQWPRGLVLEFELLRSNGKSICKFQLDESYFETKHGRDGTSYFSANIDFVTNEDLYNALALLNFENKSSTILVGKGEFCRDPELRELMQSNKKFHFYETDVYTLRAKIIEPGESRGVALVVEKQSEPWRRCNLLFGFIDLGGAFEE